MRGRYARIQRFSTKDGPGIRTTVFLKGCNLQCKWCHNPEAISFKPLLMYSESACVQCGTCTLVCPNTAVEFINGKRTYIYEKCTQCGTCVERCMQDALEITGTDIDDFELYKLLIRDAAYYHASGGGVTFSGGEPLLQGEFVIAVSEKLHSSSIPVALDTALHLAWESIAPVVDAVDLVLADIKSMDREIHKTYTGVYPDLIWENIQHLRELGIKVVIRMPLLKGVNDTNDQIDKAIAFLEGWHTLQGVELLPYHQLGVDKAKSYDGGILAQEVFSAPTGSELQLIKKKFKSAHIPIMEHR